MKSLQKALLSVVGEACDETIAITAPQLKNLLKVGLLAVRQTQHTPSIQDPTSIWDSASWSSAASKLSASARYKTSPALERMCKQIADIAAAKDRKKHPPKAKQAGSGGLKRSVEEMGDEAVLDKKDKKRKKITKVKN